MPYEIVIIGGGASGLLASVIIKEQLKDLVNVTILERLERVGKKLLATGSGKGNISNAKVSGDYYNQSDIVGPLIKKYGYKPTLKYFDKLGLATFIGSENRIYPKSENATSILDVLRLKAKSLGVVERCNSEVNRLTPKLDETIDVEIARNAKLNANYVIVATGGMAQPVLGSNGTGYNLAKGLKLKVTPIYPGLVGLLVDEQAIKGLDGIRQKAQVTLRHKKTKAVAYKEFGEIQFKKNGVSGIVIMDMASIIARYLVRGTNCFNEFSVDFYPEVESSELLQMLIERKNNLNGYDNQNYLIGIFPKMLALLLLKRAKIDVSGYVEQLTTKEIERLANLIKDFAIPIKSLDSFEHAQVSVGGVSLSEVDETTLQAKKIPHLYFCGEVLDVDGVCGGFNLQWAWTSAQVVSKAIINEVKHK